MAVRLKFNFHPSVLFTDGPLIVDGAAGIAGIVARLATGYLDETTGLLEQFPSTKSTRALKAGEEGTLTHAQNVALALVEEWMGKARHTAKKAFPGQDVKLHKDFLVGVNEPQGLGPTRDRAWTIQKSCADTGNFAVMKNWGWAAKDTTDFEAAIKALGPADETQEKAKLDMEAGTDEVHTALNGIYDHLLVIQNAGDLELPASNPAAKSSSSRTSFELCPSQSASRSACG